MSESRNIVCPHCDSVNRIPGDKDALQAKCGRCHKPLFTGGPTSVSAKNFDAQVRYRAIVGLGVAFLIAAIMGPSLLGLDRRAALWAARQLDTIGPSWARCAAPLQSEIFVGIVYGCKLLRTTAEGRGIVHWVRIDLTAPGIELYVTPLDSAAVRQGFEYRLRWIDDVVKDERLAVAINGTLFGWTPRWSPGLPGDLAYGVETVVSDHVVNHRSDRTYLLWFDDQLNPHLRPSTPTAAELRAAKWGIGSQALGLEGWLGAERSDDARTAVAIDPQQKLLFLAVAQWISPHLLLAKLVSMGAREVMFLDSGSSSAMAIGEGARGIAPGALFSGWRPVATYFGVRARPIASMK